MRGGEGNANPIRQLGNGYLRCGRPLSYRAKHLIIKIFIIIRISLNYCIILVVFIIVFKSMAILA
jgi:hypothetical protein